ncbi:MAG: hypothetical protein AAF911_06270 [Planctomycetota bacterium]
MPSIDLSPDAIHDLVGTRHNATGIEFPPAGLQPYHDWLIRTLYRLAESSVGAFRVNRASDNATTVHISPGRASIAGVVLTLDEATIDLAAFNNDTAYVWLGDNAGAAQLGNATASAGWPSGAHLKLAEVTLAGGAITTVLDRRLETLFRV